MKRSFDRNLTLLFPQTLKEYGMYEEKESNIFSPGETLWLYVEPVCYSYGNATDENGDQLYTMNFTADVTISTPDGTIISGQEDVPLSTLISHHQNKEVMLVMSVDQNPSFTPGDYVMGYTFTDENSGEDFDKKRVLQYSDDIKTITRKRK